MSDPSDRENIQPSSPAKENSQSTALETGPSQKKQPDDPALGLIKKPSLSKKTLRLLAMCVAGCIGFGVVIGLTPHKPKQAQQKDKAAQQYDQQIPSELAVTPEDYRGLAGNTEKTAPLPTTTGLVAGRTAAPQYATYSNGQKPDQRAQFPGQNQPSNTDQGKQPPTTRPTPLFNTSYGVTTPDEEARRRLAALTSGFFFPWQSPEVQKQAEKQKSDSQTKADQDVQAQIAAVSSAYESPYNKQNMAKEKEQFLLNQQADYSAYLDNHYLSPVDAEHMLMAGTLISITMMTGINSDVPGTIIAQVNENVFDSLYGLNILIPRGSRLIGTYDNSISFGQDRVLVTWGRLIRTDGVSISLRGMKGADLQGKSGLHDQVDFHLAQILAVVGASTLFNIGTNAAIAALSTNQIS